MMSLPVNLSPDATACARITCEEIPHLHPATNFGSEPCKEEALALSPADCLTGTGVAERDCASTCSASLFAIPETDSVEFAKLPEEVRQDARRVLRTLAAIHAADNKITACKVHAAQFQGRRGFTWQSLRRKYYDYIEEWNWRRVIDRAKAGRNYWVGPNAAPLAESFLEYWRQLCQENGRKSKPAHRKLVAQWRAWRAGDRAAAIPGYEVCPPESAGTGLPRGWEYSNLMRYQPTRFELKAARQGRSAAAEFRPLGLTTRRELMVGQYYLFDDFWHDFMVVVLGQRRAQRLLQFHCLDLFSGCNFARGYKPVLENEMTGATERLKEAEMIFLVAHVLSTFGYREEGTSLVVEHGTAAIQPDLEAKILELTGGLVKVERGGIEKAAAFAGMYDGRSKGNYRFKAALESLGNLIHNETADMARIPGQTGSNSRVNLPEELHGRQKHTDALLAAMATLTPERAALLRFDFVEFTQAVWLMNEIHDRINGRIDHELEGWKEAGLTTVEWRMALDQPWLPMTRLQSLPEAQRAALQPYIASQEGLIQTRKLSPKEVFTVGQRGLTKLPPHKTATLLYELARRSGECTVRDRMIEFEDKTLSPSPLAYLADARLPGRPAERLPDGEKYTPVVNPLDLAQLHLFNAKGGYVGACQRRDVPSRADVEAIHRQCGEVARIERELLEPVARRGAAMTRQRIENARHNAAVLGGQPITPEEKQRASALRRADTSAEPLLDEEGDQGQQDDSSPAGFSAEALL